MLGDPLGSGFGRRICKNEYPTDYPSGNCISDVAFQVSTHVSKDTISNVDIGNGQADMMRRKEKKKN